MSNLRNAKREIAKG